MKARRGELVQPDGFITCPCGKRGYQRRRGARRIRRRMNDRRLHVYRCLTTDLWHVGHMAPGATRQTYRTDTP